MVKIRERKRKIISNGVTDNKKFCAILVAFTHLRKQTEGVIQSVLNSKNPIAGSPFSAAAHSG